MKFSKAFAQVLIEEGYTHCFYLAGGNIMHLLEEFSKIFISIPFVHEHSATIAAEYFNETYKEGGRSFVLVTAGPGLTNSITAIVGAFLESRELLVIGGQVKEEDLSSGEVRQRGIQEIDGVTLVSSVSKLAKRISRTSTLEEIRTYIRRGAQDRPGPVFLEIPLDVQASSLPSSISARNTEEVRDIPSEVELSAGVSQAQSLLKKSKRPVLLIGGGTSRKVAKKLYSHLQSLPIPIMTTWNAADRYAASESNYFGRPNTWGQRYANVILQQSDLVLAVGTRLGLQQTGFNYKEFAPLAQVVQVDIDGKELLGSRLQRVLGIQSDAGVFLEQFLYNCEFSKEVFAWMAFCAEVKEQLPLSEDSNSSHQGFWNPYNFVLQLSELLSDDDVIIPSSSGGAMTATMQALEQKRGNIIITNKALASMGYGLAGAIGSALARPTSRVLHLEGDGGFAQNLQELGTVRANDLNIKTFLLDNSGYASIRMTQRSYFGGRYVGCDTSTGLGLPAWHGLFKAFNIPTTEILPNDFKVDSKLIDGLNQTGPHAFIVPIHSEQSYFPKITSQIRGDGSMISNPLHLMSPDLSEETRLKVLKFLND